MVRPNGPTQTFSRTKQEAASQPSKLIGFNNTGSKRHHVVKSWHGAVCFYIDTKICTAGIHNGSLIMLLWSWGAYEQDKPAYRFNAMKKHMFVLCFLGVLPLLPAWICWWGIVGLREGMGFDTAFLGLMGLILPPLAVARLTERPFLVFPFAAWLWSFFLVQTAADVFPGERKAAFRQGLKSVGFNNSTIEKVVGPMNPDPKLGKTIEKKELPPPIRHSSDDFVALPFEWKGAAMRVPFVVVDSNGVEHEISLLFDTGASMTSIDSATLRKLGVVPSKDAPVIDFHTANGPTKERLAILNQTWLGGYEVGPISVAVCDACATADVSGLLGLNVTQHFIATVDTERQELLLTPRDKKVNQSASIRHWLDIRGEIFGNTAILRLTNKSPRRTRNVGVSIECLPDKLFTFGDIQGRESVTDRFKLPRSRNCDEYKLKLGHAEW